MARLRRTLLAVLAAGALVGACSSGDDVGSDDRPTSTTGSAAEESEVLVEEPCGLVPAADLSQVTGLQLDVATPSLNTCVYTSSDGRSAVAVNFRSIGERRPAEVLQRVQETCEDGTVHVLDEAGSDGAFGCIVGGVPTVVATGGGIAALLTGSPLQEGVDPSRLLEDLAGVLDRAVREGPGGASES